MEYSRLVMDEPIVNDMTTQTVLNVTNASLMMPPLPVFNEASMVETLIMGTMFFVSLFGNLATIVQMYRMRRRKSTVNTLIINLATADLLVTFFCMGTEAIWNSTVQWYAGDVMCKFVKFAQVFALNLSTCVTVVISLDRCCVVLDPMSRNKAPRRVRTMIILSWIACTVFSIPQIFIFKVVRGPWEEEFLQCVDHGYEVAWGKKVYNIVTALFSFIIPLLIMGTAYGLISGIITRKSKDFREPESSSVSSEHGQLRGQVRSHLFRKAKRKALRMSIVIVVAFIVCWTPYYVLFTCFTFLNFQKMPETITAALSFIGLSNSLLNPMIYGAFHLCKVHSPRSWRRKEWPSTSVKCRRVQNVHVQDLSLCEQQNKYIVLNPKKRIVILCHCADEGCKRDRSKEQCLFVLYKVNPSSNGNPSNEEDIDASPSVTQKQTTTS